MSKRRTFRRPDSKVTLSTEDREMLRTIVDPSVETRSEYAWRSIEEFTSALGSITSASVGVDVWAVPPNADGFPHDHELGRFVNGAVYAGPLGQSVDIRRPLLSYIMAGSEWLSPRDGGNLSGYVITHFRLIDNRPPQKTA